MAYFEDRLLDLLPPLYREHDANGDLEAFLRVPGITLDGLKKLIDELPSIFDIDRCEARFIPLLANIVGYRFDPTRDCDLQRREIRKVVESYRRKGSIPAIQRSLSNAGWEGKVEETFHRALRLNRRSQTNAAKLPGQIYSLGVYRLVCDEIVAGLREALAEQHPAGTKVFFTQWLRSQEALTGDPGANVGRIVTLPSDVRPRDAFIVGRTSLNSRKPLSWRQSNWSLWQRTDQATVQQKIEQAAVLISRWHARSFKGRLNAFALNTGRTQKVDLSERRLAFTCPIAAEPSDVAARLFLRIANAHLNRSKLARATRQCRVIFREKDQKSASELGIECATNLYVVTKWPEE